MFLILLPELTLRRVAVCAYDLQIIVIVFFIVLVFLVFFIIIMIVFIILIVVFQVIKVSDASFTSSSSSFPLHFIHKLGFFDLQSVVVGVEVESALQVFEVCAVRLEEALIKLLEGLEELLVVLSHLLYRLKGYLGLQVFLVDLLIRVFLLEPHKSLVLVNRALVEVILFLVSEHIDLVEQLLQSTVEAVVLLVQQRFVHDCVYELALALYNLVQVLRLLDVVEEDLPLGLEHLDHDIVVNV